MYKIPKIIGLPALSWILESGPGCRDSSAGLNDSSSLLVVENHRLRLLELALDRERHGLDFAGIQCFRDRMTELVTHWRTSRLSYWLMLFN